MGLNPALHSTCFLREKSGTADWCGLPDFEFFFAIFGTILMTENSHHRGAKTGGDEHFIVVN
jgi:hypothetical protein